MPVRWQVYADAMRVSELARAADVSARTVRYYVDRGLIRPARRSEGGYRLFDDNALRQLRFLRRLQGLGLTLRELQQLLRAAERQSCGQTSAAVTRTLESQLGDLDRRLEELGQVRHELASILARERGGCTDELCLCNHEQLVQVESRRSASVRVAT